MPPQEETSEIINTLTDMITASVTEHEFIQYRSDRLVHGRSAETLAKIYPDAAAFEKRLAEQRL